MDLSRFEQADFVEFLLEVVSDMSKPVERDNKVHIEYVPTQIFTDLFSYDWFDRNQRLIEGLRYPCSRVPGGSSYVFFYSQDDHLSSQSAFEMRDHVVRAFG